MRRLSSKTVLYFILDWGLGHATRSIPVIRGLLKKNHKVVIVSTGRSLALLRREFGACEFADLPDYGIRYSRVRWFLVFDLLARMPRILLRLILEHRGAEKLAVRFKADVVVSDNRYGCFSRRLPSYLITHQLRFQLPKMLRPFAWISEWFNRFQFRHYMNVFVPDESGTPNLSGDLSHRGRITKHPKVRYVGPLSSLETGGRSRGPSPGEAIDILFLISGPEPQRTKFEALIRNQAGALPGRKVIVLGKPEEGADFRPRDKDGLSIHPHLERNMLSGCLKRARWVVSRSGYSTVMELMAFHRKAILIPTPGQTEQEYLAGYLHQAGTFFSAGQDRLDLSKVFDDARRFYGREVPRLEFNRIDSILSLIKDSNGRPL
jgi:predicted glycosyltransferase